MRIRASPGDERWSVVRGATASDRDGKGAVASCDIDQPSPSTEESQGFKNAVAQDAKSRAPLSLSRALRAGARASLSASRVSPACSRVSLAGSRASLSASRASLIGSRLSRVGSRNSLGGSRNSLEQDKTSLTALAGSPGPRLAGLRQRCDCRPDLGRAEVRAMHPIQPWQHSFP